MSCNPIWDEGDALREILTGINRQMAAETGGDKEAASKDRGKEEIADKQTEQTGLQLRK